MPTLELRPTTMVAGGDALARDEGGRVVFVAGALPGEAVVVEVVEEHKDFARARLIEVVEPAAERRTPPCPWVASGCGGCAWQHVDPGAQRRFKAGMVTDALRRQAAIEGFPVAEGPDLPATGYRTTLRMAVEDGRAAYRRAHAHETVVVEDCLIAHPLVDQLVSEGRFGEATEVTLRAGSRTGERLVVVSPTATGVSVPDGVAVVGLDQLRRGKRAWIHEEVDGRRWRISAQSFFQARPDGADALVAAVRAGAGDGGGHVVDAYGGVGLFAGTVGAETCTLVERSASAVADARTNLHARGTRILRLDLDRWRPAPADVVVADPPRAGLGRRGVAKVAATGAGRIVLVSCDAAALGRDAGLLVRAGYELAFATMVDVFPHTPHVEVVTAYIRVAPRHRTGAA